VSNVLQSESSSAPLKEGRRSARELSEKVQSLRLSQTAPTRGFPWFPWILCVLFAGSTAALVIRPDLLSALGSMTAEDSESAAATGTDQPALASSSSSSSSNDASASTPAAGSTTAATGNVVLEAKGYIIPAHQILVSPKVSGMILKLNIEEGRRIKKGEILAELETTEYQADFDRSQALYDAAEAKKAERDNGYRVEEKAQARADYEEAEITLLQLQSEYERAKSLRANGTLSKSDFDAAESIYYSNRKKVSRLKSQSDMMEKGERQERKDLALAELAQARAELSKAKWRLDNCTLRAPILGTILKKNAEEGNIVNPVAFNGSFSVCDMADLSDLEVELNVQERDISQVFEGQRCTVRAEAWPDRKYEGYVSRLMPIADRSKAAVPVRVKLTVPAKEEGVYLKPEMGAIVSFHADRLPAKK